MKVAWFRGHQTPYNRGAEGIRPEEELINEVSHIVLELLEKKGVEVVDCTPGESDWEKIKSAQDSLKMRCERANENNVDRVISLHFNCYDGKAHGAEVFYTSEAGKKVAEPIQEELTKLGFTDRGVKKNEGLYVLNYTKAPAVLIEAGFCDSPVDMKLYDPKNIGESIVKGITGEEVSEKKEKLDIEALEKILDSLGYIIIKK